MRESFRKAAQRSAVMVGSPAAFLLAVAAIVAWGASGVLFGFSDTWQLVINTATTIITFLMVFLIQNTQNRDSRAIHVKLDELILYTKDADNEVVDLDSLTDEEVDNLEQRLKALAHALEREPRGGANGDRPGG